MKFPKVRDFFLTVQNQGWKRRLLADVSRSTADLHPWHHGSAQLIWCNQKQSDTVTVVLQARPSRPRWTAACLTWIFLLAIAWHLLATCWFTTWGKMGKVSRTACKSKSSLTSKTRFVLYPNGCFSSCSAGGWVRMPFSLVPPGVAFSDRPPCAPNCCYGALSVNQQRHVKPALPLLFLGERQLINFLALI